MTTRKTFRSWSFFVRSCQVTARCATLCALFSVLSPLFMPQTASAQSLRGSSASLDRQNRQARHHDYTFLDSRQDLRRFVEAGRLVRLEGNANYRLNDVSFEVARPEVRLFVERLSGQYRRACGEALVVTSLTRPRAYQPGNASPRSVHPTGMALDLRVPQRAACRQWLERTLLHLDGRNVLDVTLEHHPPHYHVALFPQPYLAYVAAVTGRPVSSLATSSSASQNHVVRRGETLWRIAQNYDTTPAAIRRANRLSSSTIRPGQQLVIPPSGD